MRKALCGIFLMGAVAMASSVSAQAAGNYTYVERQVETSSAYRCSSYRCAQYNTMKYIDRVYTKYKDVYLDGTYVTTETLGTTASTQEAGCYCPR